MIFSVSNAINICKDNVKSRLATLYYAAATKEEVVPSEPITLESLTEIDVQHRTLALNLITLLTEADFSDLAVATLLRHPLFTRWSEEGRSRLIEELQLDEKIFRACNREKLEEWESSLEKNKFSDEQFCDFKGFVSA